MSFHWFQVSICAGLFFHSSANGGDWPEFRGPTAQGHSMERNLPIEWSATRNVAWKQAIAGKGWSSPVIANGKIFLTSAIPSTDGASLSLRALCLDQTDGHILWNTEIFVEEKANSPSIHNKNSHASPTPIVQGNQVFFHFGHMGTACLSSEGAIIWRNSSLKYEPVHGAGGSPLLVDDMLVFSCDGGSDPFLAALDTRDGSVRWKVRRDTDAAKTFSFSTPLLIDVEGRQQVISPGSNVLAAYEPENGQEIWRVRFEGYSVIPRPVYGHGLLFIGTGYDRPSVMAVRPDGKGDATSSHVEWTVPRGAPHTPSLLLVGDELYMLSDSGVASCLDARTGRLNWQERIGGNCSASPIFADNKIYFQNEAGLGVVIKPGKEFRKLASNELNERTLASYAVSDGALFIRSENHVFRIQADATP
ncbi:MAG: PQQ-binding-like beta-propeller repeat protein [Verrucomicrobia bacterium]|nr:PQQ-binding-like beta-propeller repeat protein [Verrucomicrobiota bacterium]